MLSILHFSKSPHPFSKSHKSTHSIPLPICTWSHHLRHVLSQTPEYPPIIFAVPHSCLIVCLPHRTCSNNSFLGLQQFLPRELCSRGICHGRVSVCPSVCVCVCLSQDCSTKTANRRMTQITPYDSPGTLVFWRQIFFRNSNGVTPKGGRQMQVG